MKTITAKYKGNRILELEKQIDLPEETDLLVLIPDSEEDDLVKIELRRSSEETFSKVWSYEGDEVWNEYL